MSDIYKEIKGFIRSPLRNGYITDDVFNIYVRKSRRAIQTKNGREIVRFFDIANITVRDDVQGQGHFQKFLEQLFLKFPELNIYIECILSPIVVHICEKFEFTKDIVYSQDINYYKLSKL